VNNKHEWVLVDTETSGVAPPIYTVELAAQRMQGWERSGPPLRRLLNQNAAISPEASRVNGYTREILERDGEEPLAVWAALRDYVGGRPLVSYNLAFDLDQVLLPEWARLGIAPIGQRGFCALRLARRLLDPIPAGNCKLQTLRQYYRLPERGAHTALGDVDTIVDLMQEVLRPLAEARALISWAQLRSFAEDEWYPSRLSFGKHQGRDFRDARDDSELFSWLEWLAAASNMRSARMGRWCLNQLATSIEAEAAMAQPFPRPEDSEPEEPTAQERQGTGAGAVVLFVDRDLERLRALISHARTRLAGIQAEFTAEKSAVDAMSAALFRLVRDHYQRRDRLLLLIEYRRKFLDALFSQGETEAEQVKEAYQEARQESDAEYEEADRTAAEKAEPSEAEKQEINTLWRKLVRLFHPDRYVREPERQAIYERLTAAINEARDSGNIALLRDIAEDPDGFIAREGWGALDIARDDQVEDFRKLYEAIEIEIVTRLDAIAKLRESPDYELMTMCRAKPEMLDRIAEDRTRALDAEIEKLAQEADRLHAEIRELTGELGL
jgi:DNA polymerase-3 subunit epsilon